MLGALHAVAERYMVVWKPAFTGPVTRLSHLSAPAVLIAAVDASIASFVACPVVKIDYSSVLSQFVD